jgi:transcriptional regulator with XRE-family HTH domain
MGMDNCDWEQRLRKAIAERWTDKGRSLTDLGRAIGMGQNYVSQMLAGKAPKAQAVINIAKELEISLTWLFLGVEMTVEDEQLLLLASKIDTAQKRKLLDLLTSIASETP